MGAVARLGGGRSMSSDLQTPVEAAVTNGANVTAADLVTLLGYGLGLWWASGGPGWAALVSMACDELDQPLARRLGTTSMSGDALDWGADIALTPLAMVRLSQDLGKPGIAAVGAPLVLAVQAKLKAGNFRPPVGSARALIMAVALMVEREKRVKARRERRATRRGKDDA